MRCIVVTEWNEFKQLDLERVRDCMRKPTILDGRNIYDPETMKGLGFTFTVNSAGGTTETVTKNLSFS